MKESATISEPPLNKYPSEVFGYPFILVDAKTQTSRRQQYCPFIKSECKKPRKSEPSVKVGVCSVGYRKDGEQDYIPVVICPYRYEVEGIFDEIAKYAALTIADPSSETLEWIPEVSLKGVGSVDYVLAKIRNQNFTETVDDFVCVEFQGAGTTGTPWDAVVELLRDGRFSKGSYGFGINWANEFVKTMMQQVYKKGVIIEAWKEKIFFVFQDVGMRYIRSNYDASGLRPATSSDSIHFLTFKMAWNDQGSRWDLLLDERLSTDTEGVRRILSGISKADYPTVEQFKESIIRKMKWERT